jgi:hypothetical protein
VVVNINEIHTPRRITKYRGQDTTCVFMMD